MRPIPKTNAEQVALKLRQIEVQTAQARSLVLAYRDAEITEQSYYCWRNGYGGLQVDQVRMMKDLKRENAQLRRLTTNLTPEKAANPRGCSAGAETL